MARKPSVHPLLAGVPWWRRVLGTLGRPVLAGIALGMLGLGVGAVLENREGSTPPPEEPSSPQPEVVVERPVVIPENVLVEAPAEAKGIIADAELCIQELIASSAGEDVERRILDECITPARERIESLTP